MKVYFLHGCFPCSTSRTKKKKLLILAETCFPCKNAQQALVRNILFFSPVSFTILLVKQRLMANYTELWNIL